MTTTFNYSDYKKVFVYGSLKSGFGNHSLLDDAEFLGTTYTKNTNFIMFSFGHFPAVIKDDDIGYSAIEGEVYLVDRITMFKLDMLEGNGHFYKREEVELDDGQKAWMYLLMSPSSHMSDEDTQIEMKYYDEKMVSIWREDRPTWLDEILAQYEQHGIEESEDDKEERVILLGSGEETYVDEEQEAREADAEWERFNKQYVRSDK